MVSGEHHKLRTASAAFRQRDVAETATCFRLPQRNRVRAAAIRLVHDPKFDSVILFCIVLNSLAIGTYDYSVVDVEGHPVETNVWKGSSWRNRILNRSEPLFLAVFTIEMSLKVLARGFAWGRHAYLRDGWNCLDFVVVATGFLEATPGMPKLSFLRLFRVLRPLRTLNHSAALRQLVGSLLGAMPGMGSVLLLLSFVFAVWGILGLQVWGWQGTLHGRCRLTPVPLALPPDDGGPGTIARRALLGPGPAWAAEGDPESMLKLDSALLARWWWANDGLGGGNRSGATPEHGRPPTSSFYPVRACVAPAVGGRADDPEWEQDESPWAIPHDCAWPLAPPPPDGIGHRLCAITSGDGLPSTVASSSQHSANKGWRCPPGETCGSSFDLFGHPRFLSRDVMTADLYRSEFNYGFTNFDDIFAAFLTIFQCITMEGWTPIMYMVSDALNKPASVTYFFALTLIGGILLINLILAVIYEQFEQLQREGEAKALAEAFEAMDVDGSGTVTVEDLRQLPMYLASLEGDCVMARRIERLIELADNFGEDGHIDKDEFKAVFMRLQTIMKTEKAVSAGISEEKMRTLRGEGSDSDDDGHQGDGSETSYADTLRAVLSVPSFRSGDGWELRPKRWRARLLRAVMHPVFETVVTSLIVINTAVLSLERAGMTASQAEILEDANFALACCFAVEALLKLTALGPRGYASGRDGPFNLFDGLLVLVALVECIASPPPALRRVLGLSPLTSATAGGLTAMTALRTLRAVRLVRLLRAVRLQNLLRTVLQMVTSVAYFGLLLMLFIYVFALCGQYMFANRLRFDQVMR